MKIVLAMLVIPTYLATHAEAGRARRTVLEKEISEVHCEATIAAYAHSKKLTLRSIGNTDYIFLDASGEHSGNGYYSQGVCYIYRNAE